MPLQEWLAQDVSALDPGLLVIGREVETGFGGCIDLVCVDVAGGLVVVELTLGRTPREVVAQVLDCGSWVADRSHDRVTAITDACFRDSALVTESRRHCGHGVPETLSDDHRMLVADA